MSTAERPAAEARAEHPHPIAFDFTVRIQGVALPEAVGGYSILIPSLGIATQGETIEECRANAIEVAEGVLQVLHDDAKEKSIAVARGEA